MAETPVVVGARHARIALVLAAAGAVSVPLLMPYLFALMPDLASRVARIGISVFVAAQTLQAFLVLLLLAWTGLRLGYRYGLDAPVMRRWFRANPAVRRTSSWRLALGLGLAAGAACMILDDLLRGTSPALAAQPPAAWKGLLGAFYGGISEEIGCRLFLVSVLVWIVARMLRLTAPGAPVYWGAVVVAALLFGTGHLPALARIAPLDLYNVTRTVALNALGGIVFGWLFWRRGLEHAMVAHFSADIVLHVLAPLLAAT